MFSLQIKKLPLFPASARQELVGIEIGSEHFKLIQLKDALNKRELVNLISRPIAGLPDIEVSKIIKASLEELKLKNPRIITVIPAHQVITKNIEIPSIDHNEIQEIVNLQASRHTPYSREEIIVDYIELGIYKNSYTKILLVIITNAVIKKQFELMDKAGFKSHRVIFAAEALAKFSQKYLRLETDSFPAAIIHIDESHTCFEIAFKSKPFFIRSIPIGVKHLIAEKEKYEAKFIEEIKNSLEAYQSENIEKSPPLIVLTGALEELGEWNELLHNALHIPVKSIPYFKNLLLSSAALSAASLVKHVSFLDVLASGFLWQELKVDLIPQETKLRKSLEERAGDLIKSGVLALSVFALVFFILTGRIYFRSSYLSRLNAKYQAIHQEAEKLEKDFSRNKSIRKYILHQGYSLEILTALYDVIPPGLKFDDIKFDGKGKFSLRGSAESMSSVFSLVDNMGELRYFKNVKLGQTAKRKSGLRDVTDFEVTAALKPAGNGAASE